MKTVIEQLEEIGIVPVVVIENEKDAASLAGALCRGGLPCAEVTFRTSAAAGAIRKMVESYPEMLVGAGTVLTTAQVDEAVKAGAKFIVSPGLNPDVVNYCTQKSIPIVPGINDPSGIELAMSLGLRVVKFFPAEASGGLAMIKAMSAPYSGVRFMPTGGINEKNIGDYLRNPKVLACGGSYMVKKDFIEAGRFDEIEEATRVSVKNMLGFQITKVSLGECSKSIVDSELGALIKGNEKDKYVEISTTDKKRTKAYLERKQIIYREADEETIILAEQNAGFEIRIKNA